MRGRSDLHRIDALSDDDIDYTDAPQPDLEEFWQQASPFSETLIEPSA